MAISLVVLALLQPGVILAMVIGWIAPSWTNLGFLAAIYWVAIAVTAVAIVTRPVPQTVVFRVLSVVVVLASIAAVIVWLRLAGRPLSAERAQLPRLWSLVAADVAVAAWLLAAWFGGRRTMVPALGGITIFAIARIVVEVARIAPLLGPDRNTMPGLYTPSVDVIYVAIAFMSLILFAVWEARVAMWVLRRPAVDASP